MLNGVLKGFLPWFRYLQQRQCVRLLESWLSRRGINHQGNPCTMEAIIKSIISALEPIISAPLAWSEELYTLCCWRRSQITCGGTWVTLLTWMHAIYFTCRVFDSMLEVILAAIYSNLMSVYPECLNFGNRCLKGLHT